MDYRSSKLKTQSSKKAPVGNGQWGAGDELLYDAWLEEGVSPLVLKEEPLLPNGKPRDLLERTAQFGEAIVRFARKVPLHPANARLISQVVGAGTSVGANYCEANEAVSKKDFRFMISRCMKEAKETKFFLRMIAASESSLAEEARTLYKEAHELLRIFGSMRHH